MRIDGKEIAEKIFENLKDRVGELEKKNVVPHLAVILVGANPASVAYVTLKQKKGEAIGAKVSLIRYETDVTTVKLADKVEELNNDPTVHGILIQRPLPPQIDVEKLELLTDPEKDVDGFHPDSPYTLPLPLAVVKILEEICVLKSEKINFNTWLKSKNIVVLGKGPTGGGPIIKLLKKLGTHPQVIDSKTEDREELMKTADIIIGSVGRENVILPENIKKGVILIGVGILKGNDGKLKGDYDPEKIKDVAGYYTPTPGGVGPVNVAMLMVNLIKAAEKQTK
ncbi:MAG TPA: bifunctional 5,10-methylenetetrahydrofolate dehydrogenase/5,10-methenyltetrahydrofolate cyclohydrolase [Candidatus Limnocylindrales bacterium]|nr:bifunctional 5,10-methylenetetrahydrofolate dehydrogenase/5,10-methenyltetrahydrofolate cyclohydrolase [Candidatus Limnocylindrales bacterium]